MADLSRVNEKMATLSAKVEELVAYKNATPPADGGQSEVDAIETKLDEILARIP
jgi:hypothetical protein